MPLPAESPSCRSISILHIPGCPVAHRIHWFWIASLPSESGFSSFEPNCDHARKKRTPRETAIRGGCGAPRVASVKENGDILSAIFCLYASQGMVPPLRSALSGEATRAYDLRPDKILSSFLYEERLNRSTISAPYKPLKGDILGTQVIRYLSTNEYVAYSTWSGSQSKKIPSFLHPRGCLIHSKD